MRKIYLLTFCIICFVLLVGCKKETPEELRKRALELELKNKDIIRLKHTGKYIYTEKDDFVGEIVVINNHEYISGFHKFAHFMDCEYCMKNNKGIK